MSQSLKALSISNIVPSYVLSEYPHFVDFMRTYYEWQTRSTVNIDSTVGSTDVSTHFYSQSTELQKPIEVVVSQNESYIVNFDDEKTFINNEGLYSFTFHDDPVVVDVDSNTGNYFFNRSINPVLTLFRGQKYFFLNESGFNLFFKEVRTTGPIDQFANVINNGTNDPNQIIEIQVDESFPSLLYYTIQGQSTVGTITIRSLPADFPIPPIEDISIHSISIIDTVFYHTEYLYNNFEDIVTINAPDQFFLRYLQDFGLEKFFSTNFRNRRALLDFLRFFRSKGTESSIKFFFKNFFDRSIEIDYPGLLVLKPSDSRFFVADQLFIRANRGLELTRNRRILGNISGAIGIIESFIFDVGRDFFKVFLQRSKTQGVFQVNEGVSILDDFNSEVEYDIEGNILGTVDNIQIEEPGVEYEIGSTISNSYLIAGFPTIIDFFIEDITHTNINQIRINDPGQNYSVGDRVIFPQPRRKTVFRFDVSSTVTNTYTVPVTYADDELYLDSITSFENARFSYFGRSYRLRVESDSTTFIIDDSFPFANEPFSFTEGELILIEVPLSNLNDPFFDSSFFHPSNSVTKNGAEGYVSKVGVGGEIREITMTNRGSGYIKRPNVNSISIIRLSESEEEEEEFTDADVSVFGANFGGLKKIREVFDVVGVAFDTDIEISRPNFSSDENAIVRLISGPYAKYGEFFEDNKGFLSDRIFIHDSFFYQDYSYVIKSDLNLSEFAELFRNLVHPAGMIFFNEFLILNVFRIKLNRGSDIANSVKTIKIKKTPALHSLKLFFNLVSISTIISKFFTTIFDRELLRSFRWSSQTFIDLYDEYGIDEGNFEIQLFENQPLSENTLIPRTTDIIYNRYQGSVSLEENVTGSGTISYSDSFDEGNFSDFQIMTGSGTDFIKEVSILDIINSGGESFLVYRVNSETELIVQRILPTIAVSLSNETFTVLQRKKTELNGAMFSELYQFGDFAPEEYDLENKGTQLSNVFVNV